MANGLSLEDVYQTLQKYPEIFAGGAGALLGGAVGRSPLGAILGGLAGAGMGYAARPGVLDKINAALGIGGEGDQPPEAQQTAYTEPQPGSDAPVETVPQLTPEEIQIVSNRPASLDTPQYVDSGVGKGDKGKALPQVRKYSDAEQAYKKVIRKARSKALEPLDKIEVKGKAFKKYLDRVKEQLLDSENDQDALGGYLEYASFKIALKSKSIDDPEERIKYLVSAAGAIKPNSSNEEKLSLAQDMISKSYIEGFAKSSKDEMAPIPTYRFPKEHIAKSPVVKEMFDNMRAKQISHHYGDVLSEREQTWSKEFVGKDPKVRIPFTSKTMSIPVAEGARIPEFANLSLHNLPWKHKSWGDFAHQLYGVPQDASVGGVIKGFIPGYNLLTRAPKTKQHWGDKSRYFPKGYSSYKKLQEQGKMLRGLQKLPPPELLKKLKSLPYGQSLVSRMEELGGVKEVDSGSFSGSAVNAPLTLLKKLGVKGVGDLRQPRAGYRITPYQRRRTISSKSKAFADYLWQKSVKDYPSDPGTVVSEEVELPLKMITALSGLAGAWKGLGQVGAHPLLLKKISQRGHLGLLTSQAAKNLPKSRGALLGKLLRKSKSGFKSSFRDMIRPFSKPTGIIPKAGLKRGLWSAGASRVTPLVGPASLYYFGVGRGSSTPKLQEHEAWKNLSKYQRGEHGIHRFK